MVCDLENKRNNLKEIIPKTVCKGKNFINNMHEELHLHHLAGGNFGLLPPLFAPNGDFIFVLSDKLINIYSSTSGEHVCRLMGADTKLISMQNELQNDDILVACTVDSVVLRWKWKTATLLNKQTLCLPSGKCLTFNYLNTYKNSESALAFVTLRCQGSPVKWFVVDPSSRRTVAVACDLRLTYKTPIVDVDTVNFKNLVISQESYVYFVNYENWTWMRLKNPLDVPVTVVKIHPKEEVVATGDKLGKIFLWRNFMSNNTVVTSLYHWHHTPVTSISFSASGSSFYSSGLEAVLVCWNIEHREMRNFLPRLNAIISHIAVNKFNTQIAVATADNAINIIGNDLKVINTLQELTFIVNDKTNRNQYPVGLRMNPQNNLLVLNGHMGHLQFISPYTRKLLYNINVVQQNKLSLEAEKILYDICVEKAAFNINWMATGEVFNDDEHLPELRLKFWQYDEVSQSYKLNTNIELPHEGGFKAIEFSSQYHNAKLLCATVGNDNEIKIWAMENSDNIYKQGTKVWTCIAQNRYKDMNVESISFSQDGSLLAAGYGNTLCLYNSATLKLKAALNAGPNINDNAQKCQIIVPEKNGTPKKHPIKEHRIVLKMFSELLENNNNIDKLTKQFKDLLQSPTVNPLNEELEEDQKQSLMEKISMSPNLTLSQKLLVYQRLGINLEVEKDAVENIKEFILPNIIQSIKNKKIVKLQHQLKRINFCDRFKAKYRLKQQQIRTKLYEESYVKNLKPLAQLLNLKNIDKEENVPALKKKKSNQKKNINANENEEITHTLETESQITRVQFATNENAHLVIACSATRVFVWNLLNLRIKSIVKLSVRRLAFNSETNLIAVVTKNNELFVYHANEDQIIYHHINMPKIHDMIWMPRRDSDKGKSKYNCDALSTLFFLTKSQEILYLKSRGKDNSFDDQTAPSFSNINSTIGGMRYSTFGKYITKQFTKVQSENKRSIIGPLKLGNKNKEITQMFMDMTTHTMPPLYVICFDFIKALIKPTIKSDLSAKTPLANGHSIVSELHDESLENDISMENDKSSKALVNKNILIKAEKISNEMKNGEAVGSNSKLIDSREDNLKLISVQNLDFEF